MQSIRATHHLLIYCTLSFTSVHYHCTTDHQRSADTVVSAIDLYASCTLSFIQTYGPGTRLWSSTGSLDMVIQHLDKLGWFYLPEIQSSDDATCHTNLGTDRVAKPRQVKLSDRCPTSARLHTFSRTVRDVQLIRLAGFKSLTESTTFSLRLGGCRTVDDTFVAATRRTCTFCIATACLSSHTSETEASVPLRDTRAKKGTSEEKQEEVVADVRTAW